MNLSIGIVGLPNVGKSTLFNALLKRQTAFVANYPFATIEPNIGIVPVPDSRLEILARIEQEENKMDSLPPILPATVKFVDIAGLVAGAHKGEGLGNKFLAHIREVSLILQVVRYFDDDDIIHVAGKMDPQRDVEVVNSELILADLQTVIKAKERKKTGDKLYEKLKTGVLEKLSAQMNTGKYASQIELAQEEKDAIADLHLLTFKPVIYVANVSENQVNTPISSPGNDRDIISISAKIEAELSSLPIEEQKAYLAELGLSESGLDLLIRRAYETLGLISFLTSGVKEVRAWTVESGAMAPQAAGVIHTDFEKGFIKALVISYQDFVKYKGLVNAAKDGKVRLEGREYVIQDGDIVEFKFQV